MSCCRKKGDTWLRQGTVLIVPLKSRKGERASAPEVGCGDKANFGNATRERKMFALLARNIFLQQRFARATRNNFPRRVAQAHDFPPVRFARARYRLRPAGRNHEGPKSQRDAARLRQKSF